MAAPLIALYAPRPQSGKSEVAKALVARRGYVRVKFADPFRKALVGILEDAGATDKLIEEMVEGSLKESPIPHLGVSVRDLLMAIGEGGRQLNPNLWALIAEHRIRGLLDQGRKVVVDDLRRPNEYETVLRLGGRPVRVSRPGVFSTSTQNEGLLESYPMPTFENNGSLDELWACAHRLPELLTTQA